MCSPCRSPRVSPTPADSRRWSVMPRTSWRTRAAAARFEGEAGVGRRAVRSERRRDARRVLLVGLGEADSDALFERAGGALIGAPADLGRDGAGDRRHRSARQPTSELRGSLSARCCAAGATTSIAPSSRRTRSRRLDEIVVVGAGEGAEAAWAKLKAIADGVCLHPRARHRAGQHHLSRKLRRALPERLQGTGRRDHRARTTRRWPSSAWARCSASRRARAGRRGCWRCAGRAADARSRRLRRQGRDLRHRRHLAQARRRHGRHEVGHGRRRRRRRRDDGARRAQGEGPRHRRLRPRREHARRQCAAPGRRRDVDVGPDDRGAQHRRRRAAGAVRRADLGAADLRRRRRSSISRR